MSRPPLLLDFLQMNLFSTQNSQKLSMASFLGVWGCVFLVQNGVSNCMHKIKQCNLFSLSGYVCCFSSSELMAILNV